MPFFKREAGINILYWIMPLLIAFVIWIYVKEISPQRYNRLTKIRLEMIKEVLHDIKIDLGRFPTNNEGLQILVGKGINKTTSGKLYISDEILTDAWGNPFVYTNTEGIICIRSSGKNKIFETKLDDIKIKKKRGDDIVIFIDALRNN